MGATARSPVTWSAFGVRAYTATTQPALPTGFWDRAPQPTPGRLRRVLAHGNFQDLQELPQQLRKQQSSTALQDDWQAILQKYA